MGPESPKRPFGKKIGGFHQVAYDFLRFGIFFFIQKIWGVAIVIFKIVGEG